MISKKGIIYSIAVLAFSLVIVGLAQFAIELHDASKSDFVEIENIGQTGYALDDVADDLRYMTGVDIILDRNATNLTIEYRDSTPFTPASYDLVPYPNYSRYFLWDYLLQSRVNLTVNYSNLSFMDQTGTIAYIAYDPTGVSDATTAIFHNRAGDPVSQYISEINISNRFKPYEMHFRIRCNSTGLLLNYTYDDYYFDYLTTGRPIKINATIDYQDAIYGYTQYVNLTLSNGSGGTQETNKTFTVSYLPFDYNYFQLTLNGSGVLEDYGSGEPYKIKLAAVNGSYCAWNVTIRLNTTGSPKDFFAYYNAWMNFTSQNLSTSGMVPIGRA